MRENQRENNLVKFFNTIFSSNRELFFRIYQLDIQFGARGLFILLPIFFFPFCFELLAWDREIGFAISCIPMYFVLYLLYKYKSDYKEVKCYSTIKLILIFVSYVTICFLPLALIVLVKHHL